MFKTRGQWNIDAVRLFDQWQSSLWNGVICLVRHVCPLLNSRRTNINNLRFLINDILFLNVNLRGLLLWLCFLNNNILFWDNDLLINLRNFSSIDSLSSYLLNTFLILISFPIMIIGRWVRVFSESFCEEPRSFSLFTNDFR